MRPFLIECVFDKYRAARATPARPASAQILKRYRKMATKAAQYKETPGLFGLIAPIGEKAIANRAERAHGQSMSETARFQLLQFCAGSQS
jgi:hypothetical protein